MASQESITCNKAQCCALAQWEDISLRGGLRVSKGQDHARVSPMDHGDGNAPAATEGWTMGEEQALELQCQYWEEGSRPCMQWLAGEAPSTVLCPDVLTCFREKRKRSEDGAAYLRSQSGSCTANSGQPRPCIKLQRERKGLWRGLTG